MNDTIAEVNGLEIKTDCLYLISNKLDYEAPDGFIKAGTTKLPSEGIANTIHCKYKITNISAKTGIYDTGFYPSSPCYASKDPAVVKKQIAALKKHIVKPYELKHGVDVLTHLNTDFWDSRGVRLEAGRVLNTNNVDDLLDLYLAVLTCELVPKGKLEGDPKFRAAQFVVEDKLRSKNIKSERADNMMEVIGDFMALYATKKTHTLNILKYVGLIEFGTQIDDATINGVVFDWLVSNAQNVTLLGKGIEISKSKDSEIIDLYGNLLDLYKKKIIKKENNQFVFGGTELGPSLKEAASRIHKQKDMEEVKAQIIQLL